MGLKFLTKLAKNFNSYENYRGKQTVANHISAFKRARQNLRRADRNQILQSEMKTKVRKALSIIEKAKDKKEAITALVAAEKILNKAASKGAIPRERAIRKTSRIARQIHSQFKA